jgi:ribosomal protein S27E
LNCPEEKCVFEGDGADVVRCKRDVGPVCVRPQFVETELVLLRDGFDALRKVGEVKKAELGMALLERVLRKSRGGKAKILKQRVMRAV